MNVATINQESHIADLYWKVLYPLSTEDKLHLAALLTNSVYEESIAVEKNLPKVKRRVKKSSDYMLTDDDLEVALAGEPSLSFNGEEPDWNKVIDSNTGKTIKPIEKWL